MKQSTLVRAFVLLLVAGGFAAAGWQLMQTAPKSSRERPQAPTPLLDVIDSRADRYPVELAAAGTVTSAYELEIRPQVGGRIATMHPEFEPGGRIPAGMPIVEIEADDLE